MLQLSIREFNKNISKSFKTLPVEITKRGVVIAMILPALKTNTKPKGEVYERGAVGELANVDQEKWDKIRKALPKKVSKTPGERGGDALYSSAPPPPSSTGFNESKPISKPNVETVTIPSLRKKLCPKHSVFSCGCKEKK